MAKAKRDESASREAWIHEGLGEKKYRQLRMHLTGALKLRGDLGVVHEIHSTNTVEVEVPPELGSGGGEGIGGTDGTPARAGAGRAHGGHS